jgi:macrolide transport system ATP-binding/permease protein
MLTSPNARPARERAQLIASDVCVTRGAETVLNHVDLVVTPTSRIAIVGENGRGKSTLLHVLDGTLAPDSGTVQRIGTLGVAEQEMPAHDGRTVGQAVADAIAEPLRALAELDAAMLALSDTCTDGAQRYATVLERAETLDAWDAERRVRIALEALDAETDLERSLDTLSVGQRYRVRLACLLGADDDFLLLDEPTNHLDRSGLDFLSAQLRTRSGGVVVVTHDRVLLTEVADTIVDLDPSSDGRIRLYGNGYAGYREGRLAERALWEQEYNQQQAEHARLKDSLSAAQNRLQSGWRPEKGTNKHGRATRAGGLVQSVHRRAEQLEAHAVTVPEPPQQFRFPELLPSTGSVLLSADRITVDGRITFEVSCVLSRGDRLVVTGPNGAGKSTLLNVLAGELHSTTGDVRRSQGIRLGFLRQETDLPSSQRASAVYSAHLDALIAAGIVNSSEAVGLSQLGLLRACESSKRIGELSMGQQRRLDLAIVLATRPHVLLLDEPTNHLSVALVDELTDALFATRAAVVVSTHDRQLLADVHDWPALQLATAPVREASA